MKEWECHWKSLGGKGCWMGSGESCWGHSPQSAQTSLSLLTLTLTLLLVIFLGHHDSSKRSQVDNWKVCTGAYLLCSWTQGLPCELDQGQLTKDWAFITSKFLIFHTVPGASTKMKDHEGDRSRRMEVTVGLKNRRTNLNPNSWSVQLGVKPVFAL